MPRRDIAPLGAPCWIDLFSTDTGQAKQFYGELFGWTFEDGGPEFGGYINFFKDGVLVAGCMSNDGSSGSPDGWNIYLAAADAKEVVETASAHGATVYLQPMQVMDLGSMAMMADPGGAAIGVWQPGTHKGFGILAEVGAPAWFELHSRDYDSVLGFYRDVFGWQTTVTSDTPEFRYTTLDGDGDGADPLAGVMDGAGTLPDGTESSWQIYFLVADTDSAVVRVVELGGAVTAAPQDSPFGRQAAVTDPTGAALALISPIA